jgi:iron complex outermembrane recepter protein
MHNQHLYRIESLRRALTLGLGAQLLVAPALWAQDAGSTNAPTQRMEKVIVVGSLIPTAEFETAQPVQIIDRERINLLAPTTLTEMALRIPSANQGSLVGNNGGTGFASGGTGVSLRGFGLNATLVLLNGRRVSAFSFANGGTDAFVNLNSLPIEAVERIDVLPEGASAQYGADAIAGVINLVTYQDYKGAELRFNYRNTFDTDVGRVNAVFRLGVGNEKFNFTSVADYYKQNELYNRDRSFSSQVDLRPLGGVNNGSSRGIPGRFTVPRNAPGLTNLGLTFPGGGSTVILRPPDNTDGRASLADYTPYNGSVHAWNYLQHSQALPGQENMGVFNTFNYKIIEDKMTAYGEMWYRNTRAHIELAPSPIDFEGTGSGLGIPLGERRVVNGVTLVGNQVTIPATNPYNPFGVDITTGRYRLLETGNRIQDSDTDSYRFLAGLKGNINDYFNYDTALWYDQNYTDRRNIATGVYEVQRALNDPNPATALNVFNGLGSPNNPNTIAGLRVPVRQVGKSEMLAYDFRANGSLLELPAGPLQYASLFEFRNEKFYDEPDEIQKIGGIVGQVPIQGNQGARDVFAGNMELQIPITGPGFNIPFFHRLSINPAFRIDDYSDFGQATIPQVRVAWRPFSESLLLRGSYSQSFRPPSLQQLYNTPSDALTGGTFRDSLRPDDILREIPITRGGNLNLEPELATQWSAGFVLTPKSVKNLRLEFQWVQIKRTMEVGTYSDVFGLGGDFGLSGQPGSYVRDPYDGAPNVLNDPVTGLPAGPLVSLNDRFQNLGATVGDFLDFGITYMLPTESAGTWTFQLNSTYTMSYRALAGTDWVRFEGFAFDSTGFPQWRSLASLSWAYRNFTATAIANYRSGLDYEQPVTGEIVSLFDYTTYDVNFSYRLPWDITLTFGIYNLLDEPPPEYLGFSNNAFAYLSDFDSPLLREYFFQVRKTF